MLGGVDNDKFGFAGVSKVLGCLLKEIAVRSIDVCRVQQGV